MEQQASVQQTSLRLQTEVSMQFQSAKCLMDFGEDMGTNITATRGYMQQPQQCGLKYLTLGRRKDGGKRLYFRGTRRDLKAEKPGFKSKSFLTLYMSLTLTVIHFPDLKIG